MKLPTLSAAHSLTAPIGQRVRPHRGTFLQAAALRPANGSLTKEAAATNSCDQGVAHHAAVNTLRYEQGWHRGGWAPFRFDEHITVSYTSKGSGRTWACHVFKDPPPGKTCYFTTCAERG